MPSVSTTQTTEVKISTALKRKLLAKLKVFNELKNSIDVARRGQEHIKADIEKMFIDAGEFNALQSGIKVDGFNARHISPTRKYYDKLGAVKRGWMTTSQIAELTTE